MSERSDLYHSTYSHFNEHVLEAVRKETFGLDIGQNSWVTVDEYDHFVPWLGLTAESHLLEVATGSGGPALYLAKRTACRVTGVDANEEGVTTASQMARTSNQSSRVCFRVADANARLPFDDNSFDAVLCIDAMNHLPARLDQTQHGRAPAQRAQVDYGAVDGDSSGNRRKPRHCRARCRCP